MNTFVSSPENPVITFARQEWSSLHATYGYLWNTLSERNTIHIGTWDDILNQDLSPRLKTTLASTTPKKDSYWIEILPDKVIVSGQSAHSTLYAVYDAFKRYAGVNWIYPGEPASISEVPAIMMPPEGMGKLYEPWFERNGFVIENLYDPEYICDMIDWLPKNRMSEIFFTFTLWDKVKDVAAAEIIQRGLNVTLGGHSMKFFLNKKEAATQMAADNPYTAKKQLDYTDLSWQEPVCQQIADYCATVPQLSRVSLWPEDLPAEEKGSFMPLYLRFTEILQTHLHRALPHLEVEHIAYNAGLSWHMLERSGVPSSDQINTLYAYWGRDYRHPFDSSPSASDARAEHSLTDWIAEVHEKGKKLTIFEYYSDHFMLSPLFPSIPSQIAQDMSYYRESGVDGIVNLIVPCPNFPDYPWKWATGFNSYVFSRAAWGDDLASILMDYYSYYPTDERKVAQQWLKAIEEVVTFVTAWNGPLFPGRIVDLSRIGDNIEHRSEVVTLLQDMHKRLVKELNSPSAPGAENPLTIYMKHLIQLSETCIQAWSKA